MVLLLLHIFGVKDIIMECCIDDISGGRMLFGDTMKKVVWLDTTFKNRYFVSL